MHYFEYQGNTLFCEAVPLATIAEEAGTPAYIYSAKTIQRHFHAFKDAIAEHDHLICYSVKANSNLSILKLLAECGSGFDIVSGGELFRVMKAHGDPQKVVFSGVGKTEEEISSALENKILSFNVESEQELSVIQRIAKERAIRAPVSLRVNPNIDPKTHPYISTGLKENKFGIPIEKASEIYRRRFSHIDFAGIDCHIGSQMLSLKPILETLKGLKKMILSLKASGVMIRHLNLGGGLGIRYSLEVPPSPQEYIAEILKETKDLPQSGVKLLFEPGRTIVGNAGILLTKVLYTKKTSDKHFVIVDAAMNDLIRPALYNAYQEIWPVEKNGEMTDQVDIVGPVCESGDFLAKDRLLPSVKPGDLLAIMSSGAYGFSMSSNYNSRKRAVEILVDHASYKICRRRETDEDLILGEEL
jgi:diaminopimelate decarboxylase